MRHPRNHGRRRRRLLHQRPMHVSKRGSNSVCEYSMTTTSMSRRFSHTAILITTFVDSTPSVRSAALGSRARLLEADSAVLEIHLDSWLRGLSLVHELGTPTTIRRTANVSKAGFHASRNWSEQEVGLELLDCQRMRACMPWKLIRSKCRLQIRRARSTREVDQR